MAWLKRWDRSGPHGSSHRIPGIRLRPQVEHRFVRFLVSLERALVSRGPSDQEDQEALRHRVQGPRVADALDGELPSDHRHDIMGCHAWGLIDEEHAVNRSGIFHEHVTSNQRMPLVTGLWLLFPLCRWLESIKRL